jgi:signal transduction histidine kinase
VSGAGALLPIHNLASAVLVGAIPLVMSLATSLYSRQHGQRRRAGSRAPVRRLEARPRAEEPSQADAGVQLLERERRRWARELHDGTLQGLGALHMLLSTARRKGDSEELPPAVDTALEVLGAEIQTLRNLLVDLRPSELDEVGLQAAIEKVVGRTTALGGPGVTTDIRLQYELGLCTTRLAAEIETVIYRIVQEALSNVVKHAAAANVHIRVVDTGGRVEARISDDGCGFTRASGNADHFGLTGMRERAALIGGSLSILSSASGTTVDLVAPAVRTGEGRRPAS